MQRSDTQFLMKGWIRRGFILEDGVWTDNEIVTKEAIIGTRKHCPLEGAIYFPPLHYVSYYVRIVSCAHLVEFFDG